MVGQYALDGRAWDVGPVGELLPYDGEVDEANASPDPDVQRGERVLPVHACLHGSLLSFRWLPDAPDREAEAVATVLPAVAH